MSKDASCPHCGTSRCYRHCYEAADAAHQLDPCVATATDGNRSDRFLVDVVCALCSQGGTVVIAPDTIEWD